MPTRGIHELCFTKVGLLRHQVWAAQVAGFCMILLPSILLGGVFVRHAWMALVVLLATVVYFLLSHVTVKQTLDSVALLNRLRLCLGLLVFTDVFVVLGLIGLSGGLARSHLTFVLALVLPILALVRGGGLTVLVMSGVIAIVVMMDIVASSIGVSIASPIKWCADVLHTLGGFEAGDPVSCTYYSAATGFGILAGVVLAFAQSYLASGDILPDDSLQRVVGRHKNGLDDKMEENRILGGLARSYHTVSRIVSLTNHADTHCSLVHPIDDLLFEAYVLALPAYRLRGTQGVTLMSNAVFAVHWLDDLVDGLGYHEILEGRNGKSPIDLERATTRDIGRRFSPHGVERIIKLIKCDLSPIQRLSFAKPTWEAGVESGLMRVILAGIIQSTRNDRHRRQAVIRFRHDAQALVEDDELRDLLGKASAVFLWSISKTDMPLVLGMCCSPSKTPHIGSVSLVLDALLMPLLVWHNLDEEIRRESVGQTKFYNKKTMLDDVRDAVEDATLILETKIDILLQSNVWPAMGPTVIHVAQEFGPMLPGGKEYADYRNLLDIVCKP